MKILIGYDGSEHSDFAIDDLQRAGLPVEAEAVVLTVGEAWELPLVVDRDVSEAARFKHPNAAVIERHLSEVSKRARAVSEPAVERVKELFPAWQVSSEAVCGRHHVELIKKADEMMPDLLVVGSQGRSAIARVLLGSVSHKVLHEAQCSVRIARKNGYGENANNRVLIAVDGSENSEYVIKTVAERSWAPDTEIRLIAVNDPFARPRTVYISWNLAQNKPEDNEETHEWLGKVIDAPTAALAAAGHQASHNIRWGDAASMILEEAAEWKPDTIFLGARGLGRVKRFLLGSVSSTVAAKAACSVEITRQAGQ